MEIHITAEDVQRLQKPLYHAAEILEDIPHGNTEAELTELHKVTAYLREKADALEKYIST